MTKKLAWAMSGLGCLAQNCALGLTFGSFGALIPALETRFDASRGLVTMALGMFIMSMSLLSIPLGARLSRWSIRLTMICGALACSFGFAAMMAAQSIYHIIALYGLLIGPGACLLGALPASTLVSNWFAKDRGKALGLINMPILLVLTPPLIAKFVSQNGLNGAFALLSGLFLACGAMVALVKDRPDESLPPKTKGSHQTAKSKGVAMTSAAILGNRAFWLLSIGVGVIAGAGTMITAHLVPLAVARSIDLEQASLLVSVYAGAGLVGALVLGWLSDKMGARNTLIINVICQIILWAALSALQAFGLMMILAASIGLFTTSILAVHSAAINEIFGRENFSVVFGMSYIPKLVFIFSAAPLAGFLFDFSGSYQAAILVQIAGFAVALLGFLFLPSRPVQRRRLGDEFSLSKPSEDAR